MYHYLIYGLKCVSDIQIPECEVIPTSEDIDVIIRYNDLSCIVEEIAGMRLNQLERVDSEDELPTSYMKRTDNEAITYIVNVAYLKISENKILEYRICENADPVVFRQWLLNYGMTAILIERQEPVLHGGALLNMKNKKAFVISGESGAGKSTISNELLNKGYGFVSDDSLRIITDENSVSIYGAYKTRRLCLDVVERKEIDTSDMVFFAEGDKQKWMADMGEHYYGGVPHEFSHLFIIELSDSDKVECSEVKSIEKVSALGSCLYKNSTYRSKGMSQKLFDAMIKTCNQTKIYRIKRPSEGMTINEITEIITNIVES